MTIIIFEKEDYYYKITFNYEEGDFTLTTDRNTYRIIKECFKEVLEVEEDQDYKNTLFI